MAFLQNAQNSLAASVNSLIVYIAQFLPQLMVLIFYSSAGYPHYHRRRMRNFPRTISIQKGNWTYLNLTTHHEQKVCNSVIVSSSRYGDRRVSSFIKLSGTIASDDSFLQYYMNTWGIEFEHSGRYVITSWMLKFDGFDKKRCFLAARELLTRGFHITLQYSKSLSTTNTLNNWQKVNSNRLDQFGESCTVPYIGPNTNRILCVFFILKNTFF